MSSKDRILPLDNKGFREDAKSFFELSIEQVAKLFDALESRQTSLSTVAVSRLLPISLTDARDRRHTFLGLLRIVNRQPESAKQKVQDELVSLGCDRQKAALFIEHSSKTSNTALLSAELMLNVLRRYYEGEHLMDTHFVISYRSASRDEEKSPLLFPSVYASIISHTEEDITKEVRLYLDANEFEALVLTFQQTLDRLRSESKALKASLADKYIELIGE